MWALPWLKPFIDEQGRIILSMHALVITTPDRKIVVDTCIGNDKSRAYPRWNMMQGDFLQRLELAGFAPDEIDTVLCTHMHVDHVGWNTRLVDGKWVPTFANADYLFAEEEWAYWQFEEQEYGPVIEDSVTPIFEAGLAKLVPADYQVCDEVKLIATPGHTPGHVSVHISSNSDEAIITGDMLHHPCQIAHPEWSSTADENQRAAALTRDLFLEKYSDQPVLVIGTHFAAPTAGYLVKDENPSANNEPNYRFDY
jgi:glyoxylase-like metal-dependent hydrolase (beta-lactamase superfamily II)